MDFFTARQPIFDQYGQVHAYELLYRESAENFFPRHVSAMQATSKVLVNAFLNANIKVIAENKDVLINFSSKAILERLPEIAPCDKIILEVLETVVPSDSMYETLKELAEKNYRIALDDFQYIPEWERFFPFIHMIKFDIQQTPLKSIRPLVRYLKSHHSHIKLLAEKIETYDEFNETKKLNFDYYQGYFFAKPEVIKSSSIDISNSALMNIYAAIMQEDTSTAMLTRLFQCDVPLCYKLLNYVHSFSLHQRTQISSIGQTIELLGRNVLKRFISVLVLAELSQNKPTELLKTSLYRARFCELIVKSTSLHTFSDRAFLTGLFSTIDAVLDHSMEEVMSNLPLDHDIKLALSQNVGLLAGVLNLVKSFEQGQWQVVTTLCNYIKLNTGIVSELYKQALLWEQEQVKVILAKENKQAA